MTPANARSAWRCRRDGADTTARWRRSIARCCSCRTRSLDMPIVSPTSLSGSALRPAKVRRHCSLDDLGLTLLKRNAQSPVEQPLDALLLRVVHVPSARRQRTAPACRARSPRCHSTLTPGAGTDKETSKETSPPSRRSSIRARPKRHADFCRDLGACRVFPAAALAARFLCGAAAALLLIDFLVRDAFPTATGPFCNMPC